jgi:hypothetical protein
MNKVYCKQVLIFNIKIQALKRDKEWHPSSVTITTANITTIFMTVTMMIIIIIREEEGEENTDGFVLK